MIYPDISITGLFWAPIQPS